MNSICFSKGTAAQLVCAAAFLVFIGVGSEASEGDPIAVRVWPSGTVTVESHWGLSVAVQSDASTAESSTPKGDLPSNESEAGEIPKSSATISMGESGSYVLSRPANQAEATWKLVNGGNDSTDAEPQTPNDIRVSSLDEKAFHLQLDGVDLVIAGSDCTTQTLETIPSIDAVIGSNLQRFASDDDKTLPPHVRNWISDSSSPVESVKTRDQDHNTVAISMTTQDSKLDSTAVWLNVSTQPWQMPEAMNQMFIAMEASCSESQKIFAALTTEQMNFQPANGTHTPRWNVEHMMGRQLLFFSQMYHESDDSIPVVDLNPAQMPPDYKFANADWTGAEEARQMKRVSDFSRRFAYLLDGYTVNDKVPGSRWPTLKALLNQMERHYSEHTANTQKKFLLPGWPSKE